MWLYHAKSQCTRVPAHSHAPQSDQSAGVRQGEFWLQSFTFNTSLMCKLVCIQVCGLCECASDIKKKPGKSLCSKPPTAPSLWVQYEGNPGGRFAAPEPCSHSSAPTPLVKTEGQRSTVISGFIHGSRVSCIQFSLFNDEFEQVEPDQLQWCIVDSRIYVFGTGFWLLLV